MVAGRGKKEEEEEHKGFCGGERRPADQPRPPAELQGHQPAKLTLRRYFVGRLRSFLHKAVGDGAPTNLEARQYSSEEKVSAKAGACLRLSIGPMAVPHRSQALRRLAAKEKGGRDTRQQENSSSSAQWICTERTSKN
uniref:Uncharacterized protein n=1 Tax=Coccidioides posadasii RMSCC 3488 TaxID=454284 RepID=A0A0J6F8P2_COCPO|nr:hypothetical protein CPAG_05713 [Coccidioides posadasii RMSCC 3488]